MHASLDLSLPLTKSASSAGVSLGAIIPISQVDSRSLEAVKARDVATLAVLSGGRVQATPQL